MKIMRRLVSSVLICCMLLSLSPVPAAAEDGTTHTLVSGDLLALMNSDQVKDGDTIVLSGTCYVNDLASNSAPWVIDKAVTIRGGTIDLRAGGILLGADVTFNSVVLSFANRVRNVIAANGYCLTLKDVSEGSGTRQVHLFCGGMSGYSVASGDHGKIVIQGSTSLGNLYAGSIFTGTGNAIWENNASVIVDNSANGTMGDLYACGAVETPVGDNWFDGDEPEPPAASTAYSVTGTVTINLYQGVVKTVNGNTDGTNKASVIFNGNGDLAALALQNIKDLSVETGNLLPAEGSSMSGNLAVASGAILDVANFGDSLSVENFIGGGTLVLGENQTLTITGVVTGETSVGIGQLNLDVFYGVLRYDTPYIKAVNAAENSFQLLTYAGDDRCTFMVDESGNWTIPEPELLPVIVASASIVQNSSLPCENEGTELDIQVEYGSDGGWGDSLCYIPLTVRVNNVEAEKAGDEDDGFSYFTGTGPDDLNLEIGLYENDVEDGNFYREVLWIYGTGADETIPEGEYTISLTIPAANTTNGEQLTLTTVLTVGEESQDLEVLASGTCGETLTWKLTEDGTLTISGEGELTHATWWIYREQITRVVIDSGVTEIRTSAFSECENLAEITLPAGLTSIADGMFFGCKKLTSISIPTGVTSIGESAFWGCESLESITLPAGLTSIAGGMFNGCKKLTSISIPTGVTSIGNRAFEWCESLESVTLPTGLKSIGERAFSGCSALTGITLPAGLTSIEKWTFSGCEKLTSISIPASVTSIGNLAFTGCKGLERITLSDGLTSIGKRAFDFCESLESITLPAGLKSIGEGAFYWCSGLTSITLPAGLTSIGDDAFCGCSIETIKIPAGVTSIGEGVLNSGNVIVDENNTSFVVEDGVIFDAAKTRLLRCVEPQGSQRLSYVVPDGVTRIDRSAISGFSLLVLPASVTSIGDYNFSQFPLLKICYAGTETQWNAIEMGNNREFLDRVEVACNWKENTVVDSGSCGDNATYAMTADGTLTISGTGAVVRSFSSHSNMQLLIDPKTVVVSEGITEIGNDVFSGVPSILEVLFPRSLRTIGQNVFYGNSNLKTIDVAESNPNYCDVDGLLYSRDGKRLILCPAGKEGVLALPDGVECVESEAFNGCEKLTGIILPASLQLFSGNNWDFRSLERIEVAEDNLYYCDIDGVLYDKNAAWLELCPVKKTGSLILPDSVQTIAEYAFWYCKDLESVTLPDGLTRISSGAFEFCENLASVKIPKGVTEIPWDAFLCCTGLKSVTLSDTVTWIGTDAFSGCTSLETVYFCGTEEAWDKIEMGDYNDALLNADVVVISDYGTCGEDVTWRLSADGTLTISGTGVVADFENERDVPWNGYCGEIREIVVEDGVTGIGTNAFGGCTALSSAVFKGDAPVMGGNAFPEGMVLSYIPGTAGWESVDGAQPMVAPVFSASPVDASGVVGGSVSFTTVVSGSPAPTLQWQISMDNGASWTDIPDATETTYAIKSVRSTLHGAQFRCVAINAAGTVASSPATLTLSGIGITAEKTVVENGISVTVHVGNLLTDPKSGEILCAVYGSSGKMLGIAVADVTVAADSESMVTLHIACDASLVHGVRVFFLGGMIPLCAAANS